MSQATPDRNPFMLMLNPEVVFAAMENSTRLSQLNRHLCRPLDRVVLTAGTGDAAAASGDVELDGDEEGSTATAD
jgi:hypothetical protein